MVENKATANRLYRSRRDRVVAGVCGGLGQYLNIDPVLVRIAFVVLFLTPPGIGLLGYIILAIVMPVRPLDEQEPATTGRFVDDARGREVAGYILVGLGLIALAGSLGAFHFVSWGHLWPLVLIGLGVYFMVGRSHS